jgi:hypothetical protein
MQNNQLLIKSRVELEGKLYCIWETQLNQVSYSVDNPVRKIANCDISSETHSLIINNS